MKDKKKLDESATSLRRSAEKKLTGRKSSEKLDAIMSFEEVQRLLHELEVHQIELEMQNQELLDTQAELETARNKFEELFHFSPVGYLTINRDGIVDEANLKSAGMLGVGRLAFLGKPFQHFILKDDQAAFLQCHRIVFSTGASLSCDVRIKRKDGTSFVAELLCAPITETDTISQYRMIIRDITLRQQAEENLQRSHDDLERQVAKLKAALKKRKK